MPKEILFELATPERSLYSESVEAVILPTVTGEITVLPGHVPLISVLVPGMVTVRANGKESYLAITGGYLEVQSGSRLLVMADACDRAEELNPERVEAARERARQALEDSRDADAMAVAAMTAALDREMARLKAVRRHRSRRLPNLSGE
ncbi:ATP synthase F1 subunit epsilon [Candidatus Uhrbacteria bacterium]|nr:ATP synthase F1 subunit epsilon [Candidatus Uhrbacteria bacterium]